MPREKTKRTPRPQFLIRLPPAIDDRLRAIAADVPGQLTPQQVAVMCIERAIDGVEKSLRAKR